MTEKDLRSLGKTDLLKLLHEQELEIERLTSENERLGDSLNEKKLSLESAGSIAEAALSVSNIFSAAQESADIYIENIRTMEEQSRALTERAEEEAKARADAIIREAEQKCSEREAEEKRYIEELWADLQKKMLEFYSSYGELSELIKKLDIHPGAGESI